MTLGDLRKMIEAVAVKYACGRADELPIVIEVEGDEGWSTYEAFTLVEGEQDLMIEARIPK